MFFRRTQAVVVIHFLVISPILSLVGNLIMPLEIIVSQTRKVLTIAAILLYVSLVKLESFTIRDAFFPQ